MHLILESSHLILFDLFPYMDHSHFNCRLVSLLFIACVLYQTLFKFIFIF